MKAFLAQRENRLQNSNCIAGIILAHARRAEKSLRAQKNRRRRSSPSNYALLARRKRQKVTFKDHTCVILTDALRANKSTGKGRRRRSRPNSALRASRQPPQSKLKTSYWNYSHICSACRDEKEKNSQRLCEAFKYMKAENLFELANWMMSERCSQCRPPSCAFCRQRLTTIGLRTQGRETRCIVAETKPYQRKNNK